MSHALEYDSIPAPAPPRPLPPPPPAQHSPQHSRQGSHTSIPPPDPGAVVASAAAALSQEQQQLHQQQPQPQPQRPQDVHVPTANNASMAGRKRKASGPGSRGVANLTPEQLAKKRANDREAQRAIRERTKTTIEGLERRIRELESQKPFQDLQTALQERDRALDECESLRKRLAAVASLVGSAIHPGMHELGSTTLQHAPPNFRPSDDAPHPRPELQSPLSVSGRASGSGGTLRRWSPSLDRPPESQYSITPASSASPHGHSLHSSPSTHRHDSDRHDVNYILDTSRPPTSTPHPPDRLHTPNYARLSNTLPSTCPLDHLLNDFVNGRRRLLQSGVPMAEVLGPENPLFDHLVEGQVSPTHSHYRHPASALLIETLSKFPDIHDKPENAAVLFMMFIFMRWVVCPCQRCYERMPEWLRPTPEQLSTPHAVWLDNIPWPTMRDKMIRATGTDAEIRLESFFVPFTQSLSVNWPYGDDHVLEQTTISGAQPEWTMTPAFQTHIWQLRNWSIGPKFVKEFPDLIDETVPVSGS